MARTTVKVRRVKEKVHGTPNSHRVAPSEPSTKGLCGALFQVMCFQGGKLVTTSPVMPEEKKGQLVSDLKRVGHVEVRNLRPGDPGFLSKKSYDIRVVRPAMRP